MHLLPLTALALCGAIEWESGSLIVLEDSNKAVAAWTDSDITHLALLMRIGDEAWVYEATPDQVRCLPLARYQAELELLNGRRKDSVRMWILQPRQSYSHDAIARMHAYLNKQLGRRYSVKGYVRRREGDGIHCAELASSALTRGGRILFDQPHSVSPGDVYTRAAPLHRPPVQYPLASRTSDEPWCPRTWQRWLEFQHWCGWACYETFTFCW